MADEQQMVLRTEDLVKKYRTRTVVNHVSINVKQGDCWIARTEWGGKDDDILYDCGVGDS